MQRDEVVETEQDETSSDPVVSAYFRRGASDELIPLPIALSGWGARHMRGSAVAGALARSADMAGRMRTDLRPVRFTADLQKPATMEAVSTHTTVVREGGRLMLVDTELRQDGDIRARARTLFLSVSEEVDPTPPWTPDTTPCVPPEGLRPATDEGRVFYSEETGWHADAGRHRNDTRKQVWCRSIPVLDDEKPTPFQAAAVVSDLTNLVSHWGAKGVRHINADITLVLAREPEGSEMGVSAVGRIPCGVFSAGTAETYDRRGVFGYTMVSSLLQPGRSVDTVTHLMR